MLPFDLRMTLRLLALDEEGAGDVERLEETE